ncbi:MAG TPA: AAA family ATPase, partial [Acidobacteriota bacterium]|nr:AAA family ATPase [Acidobacteriota bacterium]
MKRRAPNKFEIFKHGSRWVRADFHLHTEADKEAFTNWNDEEKRSFKKEYTRSLKGSGIQVGVITNHNKFDYGEYKSLRQEARKEEIFLLPGVEFSVNDGQSGVHVCIVFEPGSWLPGEDDFINRFLNEAYPNLTELQRANRNAHSDWNLKELLDKLNEHHERYQRDSFVILAHVDQEKGFFNELNESRIESLFNEARFRDYVLGFQKVTRRDTQAIIQKYFDHKAPALVEGCDCKGFDSIGKSRQEEGEQVQSFIKIGDYNFSAIKYALIDSKRNRLGSNPPEPENAFLKSVRFETAADAPLAKRELHFNPDLNCLIGIRGSGKSTVLEAVRYGLNKKLDRETSKDREYKEDLIKYTLRSGGKIILELENRHGQEYRVERIYGERPTIYRNDTALPPMNIDENLISVLYFGQKDLSEIGTEGFSQSLMEKFFGAEVGPLREQIEEQEKQILRLLSESHRIKEVSSKIQETDEEIAALKERMKIFKENKVDEKLKRQVQFNRDRAHLNQMLETGEGVFNELSRVIEEYEEGFDELKNYESQENAELFKRAFSTWDALYNKVNEIK